MPGEVFLFFFASWRFMYAALLLMISLHRTTLCWHAHWSRNKVTVPSISFENPSTHLTIQVPPLILVSLLHSLLILCSFFFFFFTSCLERRGSCKLTERHWSLSTASADKPASHSALAGGMGHWETQSSLAGSQQSLPAPSGPTQLSTLN